jgi:hypothetical protein
VRSARAASAVVALVVCAWFALGVREARDTSKASALVSKPRFATAAEAREVRSLLHDARLLNPDEELNILRGRLALQRRDQRLARQIFAEVTRSEPRNLEGWLWLAHASASNQSLFDYALTRVRKLEPILPTSR